MAGPLTRRILDVVIPATCRWIVARMRQLEEMDVPQQERWELLRRSLEGIGRGRG